MNKQEEYEKHPQNQNVQSVIPYRPLKGRGLRLSLLTDPPGQVKIPGLRNTIVSIHVGPSVFLSCRHGGYSHRGTAVHGDIDIIPAGTPALWEMKEKDTALVMGVTPELMDLVAQDLTLDPRRIEIRNRFMVRDVQLENIGWALKAEMESGYPSGALYIDGLAVSVATRLLHGHSSKSIDPRRTKGCLPDRRLKQVLAYIEDNLDKGLLLRDIAAFVGVSVSHLNSGFRVSAGVPLHRYVIRRRVERARSLLAEGELTISQIALEVGFAHQSHLAHHMRRMLGVSPRALRETLR
jgi:AraC family transcriptional regulator